MCSAGTDQIVCELGFMERSKDLLHFCPETLLTDGTAPQKTAQWKHSYFTDQSYYYSIYSDHTCKTKLQHRRLHF